MSELENLIALADWKLLAGSHKFPGPEGGTCINEAALVAAGFPYKEIKSAKEMPVCFSRPISALALGLNDRWGDADRQKLLPYVVRLAGTADTPEIERERVDALVKSLVNNVTARMVRRRGDEATALLCERATTREEVQKAAETVTVKTRAATAAYADAAYTAADAYAAAAAAYAYAAATERKFFVTWGLSVLETMLAIGNKAEPIDTACVIKRMDHAKSAFRAMA